MPQNTNFDRLLCDKKMLQQIAFRPLKKREKGLKEIKTLTLINVYIGLMHKT